MLQAILHGKAGRVTLENNEPQSWRDVFKKREDLLTAAFWSRIDYLSSTALSFFIEKLLSKPSLDLGDYKGIQFWPSYYIGYRVEPDVILKFEKADILIEVKPPLGGKQDYQQWDNEIKSYLRSVEEGKKLYFLALGNIPYEAKQWQKKLNQRYPQVSLHGVEWRQVKDILSQNQWDSQDRRIIKDCLKALSFYGVSEALRQWQTMNTLIEQFPLSSYHILNFNFLTIKNKDVSNE
ncbi:hypothetical protein C9426_35275 [Serratia sp. S1B]|nr:hypothetical protein C9426_35275 [Serratia sp. S1B]